MYIEEKGNKPKKLTMHGRYTVLCSCCIPFFSLGLLFSQTEFVETRLVWIPRAGNTHTHTSSKILDNVSKSYQRVSYDDNKSSIYKEHEQLIDLSYKIDTSVRCYFVIL